MAIKKINVDGTEHELQTTIANVDNLQETIASINEEIDSSIKELSVSGKTITYTKNDGTTGTITTQDTNTTYSAAGSSLGLVKSGGDVTISSGVITINDDSHNHTIANVDGLQDALEWGSF